MDLAPVSHPFSRCCHKGRVVSVSRSSHIAGMRRVAWRVGWLALGLAVGSGVAWAQEAEPGVELVFIDVGQGDATLIRSPEGQVALIDAGNDAEILPILEALGVSGIDLVIASHPHFDHIGGIASVLWSMPVRYFMDNGQRHNTAAFRSLMRTVAAFNVVHVWPTEDPIELGSVRLRSLPPPGWGLNTNNESIGVIVEHGAFSALLTGDAEVDELNYFLSRGVPRVTVLKASHHGSRSGVTPRWVDVTRPQIVVISCGADNAYGHPDPWALRYYEAVADSIYRTDLDGHVAIVGRRDGTFEVATQAAMVAR